MSASRRRRATAWLELTALALVVGLACAERPTRVVLVGDSITAGMSSEPKGPGYAELLPGLLGPGFEIVNVGCGGASTLDWQPDAPAAFCPSVGRTVRFYETRARPALPADVATILLGTNDARGALEPEPVEPEAYRDALRALAEALHADGARVVVLIAPPFSMKGRVRLAGYRPQIRALCEEHPFLRCGPDLAELLDPTTDFEPNDVHPNASGHAKIAAALAESLRSLNAPRRAPRGPRRGLRRSRSRRRPRARRDRRSHT